MLTVDNSTLKLLQCETKTLLRHVHGFTTPDEQGDRTCGSALHKAWEAKFRGCTDPLFVFDNAYKEWSAAHCLPAEKTRYGKKVMVAHPRRWENVRPILEECLRRDPLASVMPTAPDPRMIEVGFKYPLCEGIDYTGRLDLLFQDRYGKWADFDLKTTRGYLDSEWWGQWVLDSGLTGYCWAASQWLGKPVRRVYVLGISCAELPQTGRTTAAGKPYQCATHKMPYGDCLPQHVQCEVQCFERTDEQVLKWYSDAVRKANKLNALCVTYPTLGDLEGASMDGTFYNACRWCDFKGFCMAGRPIHLASTMLLTEHWDPLQGAGLLNTTEVPR